MLLLFRDDKKDYVVQYLPALSDIQYNNQGYCFLFVEIASLKQRRLAPYYYIVYTCPNVHLMLPCLSLLKLSKQCFNKPFLLSSTRQSPL